MGMEVRHSCRVGGISWKDCTAASRRLIQSRHEMLTKGWLESFKRSINIGLRNIPLKYHVQSGVKKRPLSMLSLWFITPVVQNAVLSCSPSRLKNKSVLKGPGWFSNCNPEYTDVAQRKLMRGSSMTRSVMTDTFPSKIAYSLLLILSSGLESAPEHIGLVSNTCGGPKGLANCTWTLRIPCWVRTESLLESSPDVPWQMNPCEMHSL